jgi:hypothetical protein
VNVSHIPKFEILGCDSQPRRALQPWEPWCAATAGIQTFQKKENMCKFLDANLIQVPPPPSVGIPVGLPVYIVALLAEGLTFRSHKVVFEKKML